MRLAFPFRRRAALSHSDGRRRDTRALAFAAGLGWALLADLASASELPRICAPCAGGVTWAAPGSASSYVVKGAHGVVRQRNERETFDWASFNLSRDASLEFKQPDASAVALNRIHQASASEIFGALKANGQIYLINQNGVLFKSGAKVDVNTLLASSLGLNEAVGNLFEQVGLVDAFKQTGKPAALTAPAGVTPGAVKVEAGAELSAAKNGRVILAGGAVSNAGTIKVSGIGGQALLIAAKDKVYVVTSSEQGVRGLAVEVGVGGTVENVGRILAEQGNVTLAGLTVNQNGIVRATTAVSANGSLRLQAQDLNGRAPDPTDGNAVPLPTRAGQVTIGAGSRSEVMTVEDSATTGVDDLEQLAGRIQVRA